MNNTTSSTNFPTLTSERLMLRNLLEEDALEIEILNLKSNELVNKYIDSQKMKSKKKALAFIFNGKKDNTENKVFY